MATTAVFAEILIVGLEAEAVLALALLAVFGSDWVHPAEVSDWAALVTVVVLAAAYVLGIIVDRVADSAASRLRKTAVGRWLNDQFGEQSRKLPTPADISPMRLEVMAAGGELAKFIEYQRSRMRVSRGTVVNAALALPAAVAVLVRYDVGPGRTALVAGLLAALLGLSLIVSERIESAWLKRLSEAYVIVKSRSASP